MGIIKKRKVLTREEETALFEALRGENTSAKEKKRVEETLVLRNMGLVVKEARRFASNGSIPMEDLVQEGAQGLIRAIQKFDPGMGKKFSTYATFWVKRDVGRMVRTSSDVIHIPEHTSEAARIAKAAIAKFEVENGRKPTKSEFEKIAGMTAEKAEEAFKAVQKTTSIHTPVGDDRESEFGDLIEDQNTEPPSTELERDEGRAILSKALRSLPKAERAILAIRYGVLACPMTPAGIAKTFGVSKDEMIREAERLGLAGEKVETACA